MRAHDLGALAIRDSVNCSIAIIESRSIRLGDVTFQLSSRLSVRSFYVAELYC